MLSPADNEVADRSKPIIDGRLLVELLLGLIALTIAWVLIRARITTPELFEYYVLGHFSLQWLSWLPTESLTTFWSGLIVRDPWQIDVYFAAIGLLFVISPYLGEIAHRWIMMISACFLLSIFIPLADIFLLVASLGCFYSLLHLPKRPLAMRVGDVLALILLCLVHVVPFFQGTTGETRVVQRPGFWIFAWQTVRMLLYWTEVRSGKVPRNLAPSAFLALFLNPGALNTWSVPQAYVHLSERFRDAPLPRIWRGGAWMLLEGAAAFALGDLVVNLLAQVASSLSGLRIDPFLKAAFDDIASGSPYALWTLIISGVFHFLHWYVQLLGINHTHLGIWRLMGYNVDPHFRFPFIAPNLAETWLRFTIHYRICLQEIFFKPAFWRLSAFPMPIRVMLSTAISLVIGSFILHILRNFQRYGYGADTLSDTVATFPYFLLLGLGISLSQWRILYFGRRKPSRSWQSMSVGFFGAMGVLVFMGFARLFSAPETGYKGWDIFTLIWRYIWM